MGTTPSLVELAARKELPRHQFTDAETVRWIAEHRPDELDDRAPRLSSVARRLLVRTAMPAAWLAEPRLHDSLHGVRHGMRTAALAALLAEAAGLGEADVATVIVAAAVHDCRRLHDQDDRGHGARAARWLTVNAEDVWGRFRLEMPPAAVRQAAVSVRLHEVPYPDFTPDDETDYTTARVVTDVVKAADALDRYRLPKLTWWPDAQHVRVDAFEELKAVAFDLVLWSEADHVAGTDSTSAVLKALARRELIG